MNGSSGRGLEKKTFMNELPSFDKGGFLDLGHPLLNRIADSFLKAAGACHLSLSLSLFLYIYIYIYVCVHIKVNNICCTILTFSDRSYSGCLS